ncbi:GumC family protein [Stenotrophobium rhamnosiphilum]|uniref:GumC family protein n=1 Tax=Stenotrophobium rhamnosiphilum TaxID=2029166 RepID=UPI00137515E8|nr:polysaccharide biosynthesis tyrosine autokinase [Stenotrophobium rhamnosiphilum]
MDLRELLGALVQHRWGILSVTVVITLLAGLWIFATTPIYRATVLLQIENRSNRPIKEVQDVYDPGYGTYEQVGTEYGLLETRELARRTIKKLKLIENPDFGMKSGGGLADIDWLSWLPFLADTSAPKDSAAEDARTLEKAVDLFGANLTIEPMYGTKLVRVHYESKSPDLAAEVANALSAVFIESNLESRLAMTRTTTTWLNERLETIRADLNKSEGALQDFRDKEQLVSVGGGSRGLVEQQVTDNAQRIQEAQRKKTEYASAYKKVKEAGNNFAQLENISVLLNDKVVVDAKTRVLEETQKLKSLASRYGAKHPAMATAKAALDSATASYHSQLLIAAQGVKAGYEVASETERQLSIQDQGVRNQVRGLDRKQAQLDALQRDVATNRDLYNLFLTRFKETESAGNYQEVVARVIDPAVVPSKSFKPQKKKILLWGLAIGFALGILSALLRHLLSDTIVSAEEMELLTGLQVLSALPEFEDKAKGSTQFVAEPKTGFSEGLRSIRTGLLLADLSHKRKKIVVTSSAPKEGKTTISCNLAMAFGQMERVLLIDCDLRRASVSRSLGMTDKLPGLTEYLSGTAPLDKCVHRIESGKIDVLPVGQIPPNPGEVLASQKFHLLIESFAAQYDRIIFDSAPCQAVSDTLLLVQHVDAVIFVVKAESTTRNLIKNSVRQLRQARAPLVGAVINAVNMKKHSKRYGTYYYDYRYYA